MSDVVVVVPLERWAGWITEGDAVGEAPTGEEWGFYTTGARPPCRSGERCYIVAHGRLRGYAPVVRVERTDRGWAICRRAEAVAVTLPDEVRSFRGWRTRWWDRSVEVPFPAWETEGVHLACGICRRKREIALVLRCGSERIMRDARPVCGPCLCEIATRKVARGEALAPHTTAVLERARELARREEIAREHEEARLAARGGR